MGTETAAGNDPIEEKVKALFDSLGIITGAANTPPAIKTMQIISATAKPTGDSQVDPILKMVQNKGLEVLGKANKGPLKTADGDSLFPEPFPETGAFFRSLDSKVQGASKTLMDSTSNALGNAFLSITGF